jgi:hypothetical protein
MQGPLNVLKNCDDAQIQDYEAEDSLTDPTVIEIHDGGS